MGKRSSKTKRLFNSLGQERPLLVRAHRFENEVLLLAEDHGIPRKAVRFMYRGTDINIMIDTNQVPASFLDKVEELSKDYEMGDLLPPTEDELEDQEKLLKELGGEG